MRGLATFLVAALAALSQRLFIAGEDAGYLEPSSCAPCHRGIYDSYRRTGMGRSFYRPNPENTVEDYSRNNTYYHEASDQHYTMYRRGGRYYQRRHQLGPGGRETNVVEKEIQFVLGSGNHARTYLHKTSEGQLVEAPVAWYAENGGFWAMNPGYDRRGHWDFRRKIDRECFFCHNAYPEVAPDAFASGRELFLRGAIPEGIDCQRCHGPGRAHVQNADPGAIVNPARLKPERQLELCLQCHLESTSRQLPYSLRRFGRSMFSYRPGEALENYILHFDHAPGTTLDDKFEIAGAGYRLMKSACFLKSNGKLTCTTCHNPHAAARGEEAIRRYVKVCQSCHADAHRASENCVECHMPKRRTEDVVHAVMTDHFIQRNRPARGLLAPLREVHDNDRTAYRGEVVPLYPRRLASAGENELYVATAQVIDGASFESGIPRLRKAIETYRPPQAEFYFELAQAYSKANQNGNAIRYYEEALRRDPRKQEVRRVYAAALTKLGRMADAAKTLEATVLPDAASLNALGVAYMNQGKLDQAVATLRRALIRDSELPEININLGTALARSGDQSAAIDAFQNALLASPGSTAAHSNLATVFQARGNFKQAQYHFQKAIWSDPNHAVPHYNYGRALAGMKIFADAESELRDALRLDPRLAEAAVSLGLMLAQTARPERAIEQYRNAIEIKPGLAAAHFNLGLALLGMGKGVEAKPHFQAVLQSDPNDDRAHLYLGRILLTQGDRASAISHLRKASESRSQDVRTAAHDALRLGGK